MELTANTPHYPSLNITNCVFHNFTSFPRKSPLYTCTILEINSTANSYPIATHHMSNKTNEDVKIVRFLRTKNFSRIPKGINSVFPNAEILILNDCKVSQIERDDLKGLENLKDFIVEHSPVTHLNWDLFKDLKELEVIMFHKTKISTIEPRIFDGLKNIRAVYLVQNPGINSAYVKSLDLSLTEDFGPHTKAPTIEELNRIIKGCSPCDQVCLDIKKLLSSDIFKDFTVTIKESCYHGIECTDKCCNEVIKVHKFLLAARSPVLARMIFKNPHATNLNLVDIPRYAFKIVLDYFYSGIIPTSKSDPYLKMKDLYAVADKLELTELRVFARNEMLRQDIRELARKIQDGHGNKDEDMKNLEVMTKSLDYKCTCKRDDKMTQSMPKSSHEDFFTCLNFVSGSSSPVDEGFDSKTGESSDDSRSTTSTYFRPKKRPLPDNLNYRSANQHYSLSSKEHDSDDDELNDSGLSDFVKIEIEDQYEIIGDFYDEVCELEGLQEGNLVDLRDEGY